MNIVVYWNGSAIFRILAYNIQARLKAAGHTVTLKLGKIQKPLSPHNIYLFLPLIRYTRQIPYNCKFIAYQIEQPNSRWWTSEYIQVLQRATWLWNFFPIKSKVTPNVILNHIQASYVPLLITPISKLPRRSPGDIDILFVGSISQRRQKIFQIFQSHGMNVITRRGLTHRQHVDLILRCKIYLNVHYYEGRSVLETARVCLALAYGKHVVSEPSTCEKQNKLFKGLVSWGNSAKDLVIKCREYLNRNVSYQPNLIRKYKLLHTRLGRFRQGTLLR